MPPFCIWITHTFQFYFDDLTQRATGSCAHYHGPILIDLLAAGARLADLELIQIQFQKELQGYRSIKKQKEGENRVSVLV